MHGKHACTRREGQLAEEDSIVRSVKIYAYIFEAFRKANGDRDQLVKALRWGGGGRPPPGEGAPPIYRGLRTAQY